jgi:hypothetical protein
MIRTRIHRRDGLTSWVAIFLAAGLPAALRAADCHVDSRSGNDSGDGLTPATAWSTLAKVNAADLKAGDRVLFHAGSVWSGQLCVTAKGEPGRPVLFLAYGEGPRPRIDTAGQFPDAVLIRNAQHVEVHGLELTNHGEGDRPRRGVHIVADNCGVLQDITVADLFIHDVNGTQRQKDSGGIIFRTTGSEVASRYDRLRIERNIIWRVDRSGIAAVSTHWQRTRWFPSTAVVIRDNWLGDVGGDGVVPWATDGCVVEHNVVQGANERAGSYNAGIWPWSTDNTRLVLNRVSGLKTLKDGEGFDSDFNCRNTVIEFNLSHDNEGGFLLICTPGQRKAEENLGNLRTVVRCNISRDDRTRLFHVSAAENTLVTDNALYIGPGLDVQAVLLSDWSGWAKGLEFQDNLFDSQGTARYGHGISQTKEGAYGLASGWGPAQGVVFKRNRYLGNHVDRPMEEPSETTAAPQPISFDDWPGPQFDPRQPDAFPSYIKAHRQWMMDLMHRQFGRVPDLAD